MSRHKRFWLCFDGLAFATQVANALYDHVHTGRVSTWNFVLIMLIGVSFIGEIRAKDRK